MRQTVTVTRLLPDNRAEVELRRKSACAGDCGSCGGCSAQTERIRVCASNLIGAQPGDSVVLESAGRTVLLSALLVYLVPIVLFFAGWAVGGALGAAAIGGALGFAAGLVPAVCYNRYLTRRPVVYTITAFA